MTSNSSKILLGALLVSVFSGVSLAQQLFSYDFSDPTSQESFGDYSYGFTFAGFGDAACGPAQTSTPPDFVAPLDSTTAGSANTTADFSTWTDAEPGGPADISDPTISCYNFAGYGTGVGNVLGFNETDPDTGVQTGNFIFNEQFTSNNLADYTITFDAFIEGLPAGSGPIPFDINLQFQESDGMGGIAPSSVAAAGPGEVVSGLQLGTNPGLRDVGFSIERTLTSTPTTFTIGLDELQEVGTALSGVFFDVNGNDTNEQGGTGPGSVAAWAAANSAQNTAQLQFQIQVGGNSNTFGLTSGHLLHIDNYSLDAPFDVIAAPGLACDFDGDGSCTPADLDMLYQNFGAVGGEFDVDGSGTVESGDISAWLTQASDVANPFNANGVTFVLGDVDFDGDVDSGDLGIQLNNFNDATGLLYEAGNLNEDLLVDSTDLGVLLNNFNFPNRPGDTAASAVPEPGAASLLLVALVLIPAFTRRRK